MKYNNKNFKLLLRFLKEKKIYRIFVNNIIKYNKINGIENLCKTKTIDSLYSYTYAYINYNTILKQDEFENFFYKQIHGKTKIELFHLFLLKNNIYGKFYNNIQKQNPTLTDKILCRNSPMGRIINDAFTWRLTEEGFDFWENIHHKLNAYNDEISKLNGR